jgi:hypothetical protein
VAKRPPFLALKASIDAKTWQQAWISLFIYADSRYAKSNIINLLLHGTVDPPRLEE